MHRVNEQCGERNTRKQRTRKMVTRQIKYRQRTSRQHSDDRAQGPDRRTTTLF